MKLILQITQKAGAKAAWPAIFAVMLGLLLMAGSGWAQTGDSDSPVTGMQATPTPTPQRNFLPWLAKDPTPTATPIPAGWVAEYFNNTSLSGAPAMTRLDDRIDFDWGEGQPHPAINADHFSVRWTRTMNLTAGDYNFFAYTDDGVRLWIDNTLVIDEWQVGGGRQFVSSLPLTAGVHVIKMEYFDDIARAAARLSFMNTTDFPQPQQFEWGTWRGEYFDNRNLAGDPKLVRKDNYINFDWETGSPDQSIPADNFSARWNASLFLEAGDYSFFAFADDGVVLYVDGAVVVNQWQDQGPTLFRADLTLGAGVHNIRMEYYEGTGGASAHLWWHNRIKYPDWRGEYFANKDLAASPTVVRGDNLIDFDWEGSPAEGIPADGFSARWTNFIDVEAGTYTFKFLADDGVRLWVDEFRALDEWRNQREEFTSVIPLPAGIHFIRVEYYENDFGAAARLIIDKTG